MLSVNELNEITANFQPMICQLRFLKLIGILFFLPLAMVVFGQEKQNYVDAGGLKQGRWEKQFPTGKPMYQGNFLNNKPVGEWKRYHETGVLKALIAYKEGSDSASASLYDVTGKLIARGNYLDEAKAGLWVLFNNGRKVAEENYSGGQKNGIVRNYYQTGELFEETEWQQGQRHGKSRFFFREGNPYLEMMHNSGERNGYCISYFPSGAMEMEALFKDDLKEGEWKHFDEKGSLLYTLKYSRGILLNPHVLDSLESARFSEMEGQRGKIPDPEDFLENPSEYMIRMGNKNQ